MVRIGRSRKAELNALFQWRWVAIRFLFAIALGATSSSLACGLEPTLKGGLTVSYPGSLAVAVAVADSRRAGLLPPVELETGSNDAVLGHMLADLRKLQSRLNERKTQGEEGPKGTFSLVLIGPSLWSHFHMTPSGVLARHHVDAPLDGKVVVLTHHAVLHALLRGDLNIDQAAGLGLIAYSGEDAGPIRSAFEVGFRSRS